METVLINSDILNTFMEAGDYNSLASYLKDMFSLKKDTSGAPILFEYSEQALALFDNLVEKLSNEQEMEVVNDFSKEFFRSLRNYAINPEVQTHIIARTNIWKHIEQIISKQLKTNNSAVVKIILQFMINLTVKNSEASSRIYKQFYDRIFILLKNEICVYEASALLYNISLHVSLALDFDRYSLLINSLESNAQCEFLYFLFDKFLCSENFWNYYIDHKIKHRILILELVRDKQKEGSPLKLSQVIIKVLTTQFIDSSKIIFQTVSSPVNSKEQDLEPYEVSLLLEVIASLCGDETILKIMQEDGKDLLINTGVLLINLHRLGQESENCFSAIQRLNEITDPKQEISQHPAFGFKVGLIRIIGNLCWKNKVIQNLVREGELIPVILDCCNMDARNPFIMQWAIFAVRNLCDGNPKNQLMISGLHRKGTVSSATLGEMGLTVHSEGENSIKIVPLDALETLKRS